MPMERIPITYSLDNDASGRFAIDAITGVITVSDQSIEKQQQASTSPSVRPRPTAAVQRSSKQSRSMTSMNLVHPRSLIAQPLQTPSMKTPQSEQLSGLPLQPTMLTQPITQSLIRLPTTTAVASQSMLPRESLPLLVQSIENHSDQRETSPSEQPRKMVPSPNRSSRSLSTTLMNLESHRSLINPRRPIRSSRTQRMAHH